jgi:hypothetical protein
MEKKAVINLDDVEQLIKLLVMLKLLKPKKK